MARKGRGGRKPSGGARSGRRNTTPVSALPTGRISITSGGFGFVESPEGRFFVPHNRTNGAMNGDLVRIRPRSANWQRQAQRALEGAQRGRQAPIAVVDRVLEHANATLVGMFVLFDGLGYVIPQDKRLDYLVSARVQPGTAVSDGDIVLLEMETYPSRHETPSGVVVRVIGREGEPGIAEEMIAARHGLETEFSPLALEEAAGAVLDIEAALLEPDRIDERDRFILTIDPADARDFDDALSLDYVDGAVRLGVHIADVSHYVPWGSALDLDARRRATSTYFPDRVIPMLPERLSNGLCSLNPGEDRLAFTVDLFLDDSCSVLRTEMHPSVIRSRLRLDYGSVQSMFDGALAYPSVEAEQVLGQLRKIAARLRARRLRRGALDFVSTELKVLFDSQGEPIDLVQRQRNEATDLVEEAMIAANEAVARHMLAADAPMVYRVHDAPKLSSVEEVVPALRELGYAKEGAPITNAQIQAVLDEAKGTPEEVIVNMMLLRAMKQAVYRSAFTTHFGLASDGYTHFTSPIRRYPDLMAHRLLRWQLFAEAKARGQFPPRPDGTEVSRSEAMKMPAPAAIANLGSMVDQLPHLCDHSSVMEREAEKASYEALEAKVCEYMGQYVGRTFSAIIVNVMAFGFFVRLADGDIGAGCEGLVPVRDLEGWYDYDDERRTLRNSDSARDRGFSLGQRVSVVLVSADTRKGQLTFRLK